MRSDMSKIIIEPARSGVGYYRTLSNDYRRAKRFKLDEDLNVDDKFTARVLPIRAKKVGWDGKSHRFAYHTAKRFLTSSLGRLWNDVYSEIAIMCKTEAAKALDLRDVFLYSVETHTFVGDDGFIYYRHRGNPAECAEQDVGTFYVDPLTGILRVGEGLTHKEISKKRSLERDAERAKTHREVGDLKFEKIYDVWFHVRTETVRGNYRNETVTNVVWKRTVSKADIRRYGLNQ